MNIVSDHHHRITAGKHLQAYMCSPKCSTNQFDSIVDFFYRRGRGSYRGRGRGNFYRQDRGGPHQMQSSHPMHQQTPNMHPYYNQTVNPMQPAPGVGYHDANYHDMQTNRYEMFIQFTTNSTFHVNDKLKNQQRGHTNARHLTDYISLVAITLNTFSILSRGLCSSILCFAFKTKMATM